MSRGPSVVTQRLAELVGRRIAVRVTYSDHQIVGEFLGCEPAGRTYLLRMRDERGRTKRLNVVAVLEIAEADE